MKIPFVRVWLQLPGQIALVQDTVEEPGTLILNPIFTDNSQSVVTQINGGQDRQLRDFAVGVIRLKSIMDVVLKKYSDEGLPVKMHLLDLSDEHGPTILASYPPWPDGNGICKQVPGPV